ncbi:hypothetical protein JCM19379_12210 [Methyloparacoccus murrellii]
MNTALIYLFASLHIADGALTYLGLQLYGLAEANPLLSGLAAEVGLGTAIIGGKSLETVLAYRLYKRRVIFKKHPSLVATLALAVLFYTGVVINNAWLVFDAPPVAASVSNEI